MARDLNGEGRPDLPAAIRRRREELFGPKPSQRPVDTIDAEALNAPPGPVTMDLPELDTAQARYEMELGAHRETLIDLLAAKDVLIQHLEQTIRERDATIQHLNANETNRT